MRHLIACILALLPLPALACSSAVCLVDPESLMLPETIDFQGTPSGAGPGYLVDDVLVLNGAQFGERFAGQTLQVQGTHDAVDGAAYGPLTLLPGEAGQNLSVVSFMGITVLNGYGHKGFPKRDAQGEGAIAILFDQDQSAVTLGLRGGEQGSADVLFLRRDGSVLARVPVTPVGEFALGFLRASGTEDIAGIVLNNTDDQGIALDTIKFGKAPNLG
ncbi:hypothetical protein [uncultured Sulfitobacter sp.]|uniref:hypothetical protein n=1 Tax=uncultured Sulfitobacter sp. TaxID=191468 RepID=UPI0026020EA7|nr:hypothetical protein [uncultured Sulfitobacter sp.]